MSGFALVLYSLPKAFPWKDGLDRMIDPIEDQSRVIMVESGMTLSQTERE